MPTLCKFYLLIFVHSFYLCVICTGRNTKNNHTPDEQYIHFSDKKCRRKIIKIFENSLVLYISPSLYLKINNNEKLITNQTQ